MFKAKGKRFRGKEKAAAKTYSYQQLISQYVRRENEIESRIVGTQVDIVVPIYNNRKYLERLLPTIEKTTIPYRLILIDDASTDPDMAWFLNDYAKDRSNVQLVRNAQNMGYVGSVNRGLALSKSHVVLLSGGTLLPEGYLERLIAPIVKDPTVALAIPFTNSNSICSFPNYLQDNTILNEISVEQIDQFFREIRALYTTVPTGAYFCMAINQRALHDVGLFDQQTFSRGGGEVQDWCQRAKANGYRNAMVENLYVFHRGQLTISQAEKEALQRVDEEKLRQKYPGYETAMAAYHEQDPMGPIRAYVLCRLAAGSAKRRYVIFNNAIDIERNSYLQYYMDGCHQVGVFTILIAYEGQFGHYRLKTHWMGQEAQFIMDSLEEVFAFCDRMDVTRMVVSSLVHYPNLAEHLDKIRNYTDTKGASLMMLLHDYYALCPSVHLVDEHQNFCRLPEGESCENCYKRNPYCNNNEVQSMREWHGMWGRFLRFCREIRVFSENSARFLRSVYGNLEHIHVLHAQHTNLTPVYKREKITATYNIGIFDPLTTIRGRELIGKMMQIAEHRHLPVRFILFGESKERIHSPYLMQTGSYEPENLPNLILRYDIDVIFASSMWPETFAYETQACVDMDIPIVCFPFGASAELVRYYEKGHLLNNTDPTLVLDEIVDFMKRQVGKLPEEETIPKGLLLMGEDSCAGHYRLLHLQEQLLQRGVTSDYQKLKDVAIKKIEGYSWIILHRGESSRKAKSLFSRANKWHIPAYFSVDTGNMEDFRSIVEKCEAVIVPTERLKKVSLESFPEKTVWVQGNVVSHQMEALSQKAVLGKEKSNKITIGYWWDSLAGDGDFAVILPVLSKLLQENKQVKLLVIGDWKLPKSMIGLADQIEVRPYKAQREIPALFSMMDINVMPLESADSCGYESENKWLAASLVKVPTIASGNEELSKFIRQNKTGIFCHSPEEWEENLKRLVEDAALRKSMGENAYQEVFRAHTTRQIEQELLNALRSKS